MEKEKYEKPYFEVINLLSEIFTEDSADPEYNDDDIFGSGLKSMLQQMNDSLEGFTEEESDKENEELEGEDSEKDEEDAESTKPNVTDPEILNDLLNELDNAASDIQSQMSEGSETPTNEENPTNHQDVSEEPVEETPVENNVPPQDTFEESTPAEEPTGDEQVGF